MAELREAAAKSEAPVREFTDLHATSGRGADPRGRPAPLGRGQPRHVQHPDRSRLARLESEGKAPTGADPGHRLQDQRRRDRRADVVHVEQGARASSTRSGTAPAASAGGRPMLVAPNIVQAERQLDVDPHDFRLWVCLHEETHRVQFTAVRGCATTCARSSGSSSTPPSSTPSAREPLRLRRPRRARAHRPRRVARRPSPSCSRTSSSARSSTSSPASCRCSRGTPTSSWTASVPTVIPSVAEIRRKFDQRRKGAGRLRPAAPASARHRVQDAPVPRRRGVRAGGQRARRARAASTPSGPSPPTCPPRPTSPTPPAGSPASTASRRTWAARWIRPSPTGRRRLRLALDDLAPGSRVDVALSGGADSLALAACLAFVAAAGRRGWPAPSSSTTGCRPGRPTSPRGRPSRPRRSASTPRSWPSRSARRRARGGGPRRAVRRAASAPASTRCCWPTPSTTRPRRCCSGSAAAPARARSPACRPSTASSAGPSSACAAPTPSASARRAACPGGPTRTTPTAAFRRSRLRHEVLPLLEDVLDGGVAEALARTADQLRADTALLDELAAEVADPCDVPTARRDAHGPALARPAPRRPRGRRRRLRAGCRRTSASSTAWSPTGTARSASSCRAGSVRRRVGDALRVRPATPVGG